MPLHGNSATIFDRKNGLPDPQNNTMMQQQTRQSNEFRQRVSVGAVAQSPKTQTPGRALFKHPAYASNTVDDPPTAVKQTSAPPRPGSEPRRPLTAILGPAHSNMPPTGLSAEDLKMEVPQTVLGRQPPALKHQTSHTTDNSVVEHGTRSKTGSGREQRTANPFGQNNHHRRMSSATTTDEETSATFDHERHFDYGDSDDGRGGEPTAIFSPQFDGLTNQRNAGGDFSFNEVEAARHYFGGEDNQPGRAAVDDMQLDDGHPDSDEEDELPIQADTTSMLLGPQDHAQMLAEVKGMHYETPSKVATTRPTRAKANAEIQPKKVNVRASEQNWTYDRDSSPIEDIAPRQPSQDPNLPAYRRHAKEVLDEYQQEQIQSQRRSEDEARTPAAKVPASLEASDEDIPTGPSLARQSQRKRALNEVDYDPDKFATMVYADLDKVAFSTDPRAPPPDPAIGPGGHSMTLEQRLANLTRMQPEDQKALFRSLGDTENEQTGQWFVQQFGDSLKGLMQTRVERRKVALKYELEARKRQKEVEVKAADIDEELRALRQGGGELIKGRGSPAPKAPAAATMQ